MNIYGPPTIGPALFGAVLGAAKSPVLAERKAQDFYSLIVGYGIDPAFILSIAKFEHSYGTNPQSVIVRYGLKNWGDTRTRRKATLGGKSIGTDRGNFWAYLSWYDSLDDLCYRLADPTYAYAGKRTVETVVPVMAPDGDQDNNAALYVRNVLAQMAAWQAQDKEIGKGGTKVAPRKPTIINDPSPNLGGYAGTRRIEAIVWHITQGIGSRGWLKSAVSKASSNYVIERDGGIYCLVDPTRDAWANGKVDDPDRGNPLIVKWLAEGVNFNQRTISIEHEGFTSNNKGGSLTPAQIASTIALTAWLCATYGIAPDQGHILGHYEVDSVDRPYCPGFSGAEWSSWVGQITALVNGGAVVSPGGTIGEALKEKPQPARPPGYMLPGQADTFLWPAAEGVITERSVTYFNPDENKYYRATWHNQTGFTPFVEVG